MGALTALILLGGVGGLGWWFVRRRPDAPGGAAPAQLGMPSAPEFPPLPELPSIPGASSLAPSAPSIAPSDFVQRLRSWLQQRPPATQIELVAVQLERAGHMQSAAQLRSWAREARDGQSSDASATTPSDVADPSVPTSEQYSAPTGSSVSSSARESDSSVSNDESNGASPASPAASPASGNQPELRQLARSVAAMLRSRQGQSTDRGLVRRFQRAANIFRHEPSGLYGPRTRDALAHHGVERPPPPRFRAELEAAPARRPAARRAHNNRTPNRSSSPG